MRKALELAKALVSALEKEENKKVALSEIKEGERFTTDIGKFIVLEQRSGYTKVITEKLYRENVRFDDDTRDYGKSDLRKLCDGDVYKAFSDVFGEENIIEHKVDLTSVDTQHEFDQVKCIVRPLTFDEARQYNQLIVNKDLRDWYWTCTPWSTAERDWPYSMAVVAPSGGISRDNYCNYGGVRPVCILKSNIFVSKEG